MLPFYRATRRYPRLGRRIQDGAGSVVGLERPVRGDPDSFKHAAEPVRLRKIRTLDVERLLELFRMCTRYVR
jgi:hypothetical protein